MTFNDFLAIAQTAEIAEHLQKFIVLQQVIRVLWSAPLSLVDEECFVYHRASIAQPSFYTRYKGALQVVKTCNNVVDIFLN